MTMADWLEQSIAPGERVIFRARASWRRVLYFQFIFSVVATVFLGAFHWLVFPDFAEVVESILFVLFMTAFFSAELRANAAAITDRRVLWKTGIVRPKISEMALSDVEGVVFHETIAGFGSAAIRVRAGGVVKIRNLSEVERFCDAVLAQAGLPPRARMPGGVMASSLIAIAIVLGSMLGSVIAVYFGIDRALDWLAPSAPIFSWIAVLLVIPAILILLLIGSFIGAALWLCIMRIFVPAAAAKRLICAGYDFHTQTGGKLTGSFNRGFTRPLEVFASWLYGRRIRCD